MPENGQLYVAYCFKNRYVAYMYEFDLIPVYG